MAAITRRVISTALVSPNPAVGQYLFPMAATAAATSVTLGNGTLRLTPWLVGRALTIDRLGGEVTTVGEAGSKYRIGIYGDTGNCYPGALLLDGGQIAGDSATVQDLTVALTLSPGLYWIGGAVQSAATTQPTMRTFSNWTSPVSIGTGTSIPGAGVVPWGYQQASVTAALPANFTASLSVSGVGHARQHVRVA